jgi:hypothetical protein
MTLNDTIKCLACGDMIRGRSDKKFCNDYCRSSFNNKLKNGNNKKIRTINNALAKNRRILESLLSDNELSKKVSREKLFQLGFQFTYITQVYPTKTGEAYYFCYDYGYRMLDNSHLLIVRKAVDGVY